MSDELDFIQSNRANSAGYHLITARKWRLLGEPKLLHSPLVYSAFEYRMSIERIVFELYALMKKLKFVSEEDAKKLEKLTSVITQIMELIGNSKYLYRILMFNSMLFDSDTNSRGKLAVPDISKLKKFWYSLSDFCHMKINPEDSWLSKKYVMDGYALLNDVEKYLWEIKVEKQFGFYQLDAWQPEVIELAEDYVNSKIDENSVRTRLLLMKPVIVSRYKNK